MSDWNVKEDFCAECVTYSSRDPRVYHYYPKLNIETSRELTADERRRVIDALVQAASVVMMHINEKEVTK